MKILFVTNEIPFPPDNGVRIVSHHAMRLMRESGHALALAVLTEETGNVAERFEEVRQLCEPGFAWWMQLRYRSAMGVQFLALLTRRLFPIERYRCSAFRARLIQLIAAFKPDVVHFDIITMTQYRDTVPAGVGVVASVNDSYALTLENLLADGHYTGLHYVYRRLQLYQARKYEATHYALFDNVHVMTEVDASYLRRLNPGIRTSAISNGVNPKLFDVAAQTLDQNDVIFVATLAGENLRALQDFLCRSWPTVIEKSPDARLYIVGKLGQAALDLKNRFQHTKGVTFVGYVERLEEIYARCGIAIVPINKNCGIINKAIEAMGAGLAVVGFDKTFAGIEAANDGVHYVSVGDYEQMGRAIAELRRDRSRCDAIKRAANLLAKNKYSWPSRAEAYEKMYRLALERANAA